MSEIEKIKKRYEDRGKSTQVKKYESNKLFPRYVSAEREKRYEKILIEKFTTLSGVKLMEIGSGSGENITFFKRIGVTSQNLYANELMPNRVEHLQSNHADIHIFPGDACELNFTKEFDVVFQSTVFTSVIDNKFRKLLANKMWAMLRPGGIVLWYDFVFSNPANKEVKKVTKQEVIRLFPNAVSIKFYKVTLAPPIGRRVWKFYNIINFIFPFLRTHIIAVIHK